MPVFQVSVTRSIFKQKTSEPVSVDIELNNYTVASSVVIGTNGPYLL